MARRDPENGLLAESIKLDFRINQQRGQAARCLPPRRSYATAVAVFHSETTTIELIGKQAASGRDYPFLRAAHAANALLPAATEGFTNPQESRASADR